MRATIPNIKAREPVCVAKVDRVQFVADICGEEPPKIPGFRVRRDTFVRPQTKIQTYRRLRKFNSPKTQTAVTVQHWCVCPWLREVKLTIVADDRLGLQRQELDRIFSAFREPRLLTVEFAIDFNLESDVDRAFVLRHGVFGRSWLVGGRSHDDIRFGSRHSQTMMRGYRLHHASRKDGLHRVGGGSGARAKPDRRARQSGTAKCEGKREAVG